MTRANTAASSLQHYADQSTRTARQRSVAAPSFSSDDELMPRDLEDSARRTRARGSDRVLSEATERTRRTVESATGFPSERISVGSTLVTGHFRRRRRWNCVVAVDGTPLAAIDVVHIPAERLSEKTLLSLTDRLLARALDASKAATAELLRPWLGAVVVIAGDAFRNEATPVTGDVFATRLDRFAFFIEQVVGAQLLDAAMVVVDGPTNGQRTAARPALSEAAFDAALAGRAMTFRASAGRVKQVSRR